MYRYPLNCIDTEAQGTTGNNILKAPTAIFLHQMFPTARIMIKAINKSFQHLQQIEMERETK